MAFAGLRLAVGTLTVIPSGPIPDDRPADRRPRDDAGAAGRAAAGRWSAAVVGWVARGWSARPRSSGLLVVGVLALGTRALHLDGLADTVDGLGSGWDRERSLEIMRRGDVGPMGVVALVIVLGLQAARRSAGWPTTWRGAAAGRAGRLLLPGGADRGLPRGVPAARTEGLGRGGGRVGAPAGRAGGCGCWWSSVLGPGPPRLAAPVRSAA